MGRCQARWTGPRYSGLHEAASPRLPCRRKILKGLRPSPATIPSSCSPMVRAGFLLPTGLQDGPLPTHYEPLESVLQNPLYGQQCNPARLEYDRPDNPMARAYSDPRFPYVITTYRLTEQHTSGAMSRWLSWLAELQPEMFCEISPQCWPKKEVCATAIGPPSRLPAPKSKCGSLSPSAFRPLRAEGRTYCSSNWSTVSLGKPAACSRRRCQRTGLLSAPILTSAIQESKALTGDISYLAAAPAESLFPKCSESRARGTIAGSPSGTSPTGRQAFHPRIPFSQRGDQT